MDESLDALRVSSPGELLSLIPYILGFEPTESLVTIVCEGSQMHCGARYDLQATSHPLLVQEHVRRLVESLERPQVFLAVFSADAELAHDVLDAMEGCLPPGSVTDSCYTDGRWWWSNIDQYYWDLDPGNNDAGQLLACNGPAVVQAVTQGYSVAESRTAIVDQVQGPPPEQLDHQWLASVARGIRRRARERRRQMLVQMVAGLTSTDEPPSPEQLIRLAVLVEDIEARDQAWTAMDRPNAQRHLRLWQQVVAIVPEEWAVPPLCLMAAAAWLSGNGVLMGAALERAESLDPDYTMVRLMGQVLEQALPPSMWGRVLEDMRELAPS